MVLIAPYASDPAQWVNLAWTNRYSARRYAITPEPSGGYERDGLITVKTYRGVLAEYATHPEAKSADAEGRPCNRRTRGLLARRRVIARTVTHIGKEANSLEESQAGLIAHQREVLNAYDDTEELVFRNVVLPALRTLGVREVARRTGHSLGAVHAVLSGKSTPRATARARYASAAAVRADRQERGRR
jgi:hypothetical protein